jgi:MFS family permease
MRENLRPIASILLGVAFLLAGNGLQFTLLPLRGHADGFSSLDIGAIGSAYYAGFVCGCLLAPYIILRAGHIRAFAALVAVAVTVGLAYPLANAVWPWIVFRLVNGFCIAGFYLVIESWLNDRATNETRGFIMSSYVMVIYAAFTAGQMMVTLFPIKGAQDFMLAAMLASLAIVPVALTRSAQPAAITMVTFRPWQVYRAVPVGLVASFAIGAVNGAFFGLGPVSAARTGLNTTEVAIFMSAATLAGAAAQWPAGRMSDRIDRRRVLLVLLIGASISGLVLWLFATNGTQLVGFGFVYGALALPGYALASAHAYDKTDLADMVPTAATVLLANAVGATIGPLLAPPVMDELGPRSLFLFTAAVELALAVYVFYRIKVQPSLAPPEKTEFDLATTAPVGAVLTTEELDPEDPLVVVPEPYPPMPEADMPAAEAPPMETADAEMPAAEGEALPPDDDKP